MTIPPPDVLLIVLDTLRRDRLSAYGAPRATSPALEALAEQATLFERAVSPAQWTVPAHASLFTGLYAGTHALTEAAGVLGRTPTLAEVLRAAGYETVGFCNNPLVGVLDNGLTRGFDQFYNYAGAAPNRPQDATRSPARRALADGFRRFARRVSNQFAHSDWLFRLSLEPRLVDVWTRAVNYKGNTAHSVDDVIATLGAHHAGGRARPRFTFLNLMGAHLPYRPPAHDVDRFDAGLRRDPDVMAFVRQFNADAARWASPTLPPLEAWQREALLTFYDAEIAAQDAHLARLFAALQRTGALDNTLVIVTADHGESHGDHNFFGHSFVVYQELVHVPLLVRFPARFPAGLRVAANVSTRRVFHTVLAAAGIPGHAEDAAAPHALALTHALNGKPDAERGVAFAEAYPPQTFLSVLRHRQPAAIDALGLRQVRRGVYDGDHKLTTVGGQVEGLFDLRHDPAEVHTLHAARPQQAQALAAQLDGFAQDAAAARVAGGALGRLDDDLAEQLRALGYL